MRRVSVSTRDLPLVEYLAGGFVHLVFRFGERLPFVFLVALVFRFGGEQRAFGEDSGTDAYAAAVDDVEEVGLSVQASSPQRFKGVSASFHVGFAYESVGAFGVAVAYGYGAVPVLEDLGVEVAYRFGEGSERVEQFAFGNVVLPCVDKWITRITRYVVEAVRCTARLQSPQAAGRLTPSLAYSSVFIYGFTGLKK